MTETERAPVFRRVSRGTIGQFWPLAASLLAPALRRTGGQFTPEGVRAAIEAGKMQLWLTGTPESPTAVAVTAVLDYPGMRVLSIPLLGGINHRMWIEGLESDLTAYGRLAGCSSLEAYVRPGFIGAVYRHERAVLKDVEIAWTLIRKKI